MTDILDDSYESDLTDEEHEQLILRSEHAIAPPRSHAAQAVLDAYRDADIDDAVTAAAVLRAAVNELISAVLPPCEDFDEYSKGFQAAHTKYRNQLLAIATELEAQ